MRRSRQRYRGQTLSYHLNTIVNEAVQAHGPFDRLAAAIKRSGYEVQISLNFVPYARAHKPGSTPTSTMRRGSPAEMKQLTPEHGYEPSRLSLSVPDVQFLKDLGIALD